MRPKTLILVVLVAAVINLPVLHSTWLGWRIENSGVDVTAQVTDSRESDDEFLIAFTVPAESGSDREEFTGVAQVDQATFEEAVRTQEITVRLLPDQPGAYRVEGQVRSRLGLIITLLADLFLALMVLLLVRFRSRLKPVLVLVATEDLARCPPGPLLDRIEGDFYVVCGDIVAISDDELLLDLGERRVRVILDGHHNPAGHDQPVRATGRMVA